MHAHPSPRIQFKFKYIKHTMHVHRSSAISYPDSHEYNKQNVHFRPLSGSPLPDSHEYTSQNLMIPGLSGGIVPGSHKYSWQNLLVRHCPEAHSQQITSTPHRIYMSINLPLIQFPSDTHATNKSLHPPTHTV